MIDFESKKRARTSLLLSMILHVGLALVAAFIIIDRPQEVVSGALVVDMIPAAKRIMPPRRTVMRDDTPDLLKPRKDESKSLPTPRKIGPVNTQFTRREHSAETVNVTPKLTTDANLLKSQFDTNFSSPTGATIVKPGAGAVGRSSAGRAEGGSVGLPGDAGIFETAMYWMARNINEKNQTGREDVVFLIDASGTMKDNIIAVARHISKMIDVFKEGDLDYTIGIIRFNRVLKVNDVKIFEQTSDVKEIRKILRSIRCDGDERTLDAIEVGLTQVEFRDPVDKTFILVTDEPFTARTSTRQKRRELSLGDMLREDFRDIVQMCQNDGVKVSILGIDDEMHKSMTKQTGGLWFQIPEQSRLP